MNKHTEAEVQAAFNVINQAMVEDNPSEQGSYAHAWHCNIAMAVYDATPDDIYYHTARTIGNEAATIFMKRCFDVDTEQTRHTLALLRSKQSDITRSNDHE